LNLWQQPVNNKSPLVSVIIINYNGRIYIDACLSSVLQQEFKDYEIILVDNNSDDGSLQHIRDSYPGLNVLQNRENLGYAGGINSGLAIARGQYIAPLNMDTEVAPTWLGRMAEFMLSNRQAGAVCPKVLILGQPGVINCTGLNLHISGLGFCRQLHNWDVPASVPQQVSGISGCSYMIKKELFTRIGGAPEYCFMYNDDVIISWLLMLMGYEMYCLPDAIIYHRYRLSMTPEKFFHLEKNRIYLVFSIFRWYTLLLLLPVLIIIEAMIFAYSIIKGWPYPRSKLGAYLAAFKERKEIGRLHRFYSSLRVVSDFTLLGRLRWNLEWRQLFGIVRFRLREGRRV
jgi:GT2 family glycosyltransferase